MLILYNIGIRLYYLLILIASLFNKKARLWIGGRRNLFKNISASIESKSKIIWFHCSSLGEFEQGRPVIEKIHEKLPDRRILLTFYSPSGYEIRKNYPGADYVSYLPLDTRKNASRFIDLVHPEIVFFVKYEYWYYFLSNLKKKGTSLYLISGIFRQEQVFFKWYGKWFRKMLGLFQHLFVQDKNSFVLLKSIGISNVTICGDTRFDRVYSIAQKTVEIPLIESFISGKSVLIAGSTWPEDEDIIVKFINENKEHLIKYIIAPHEIHERDIRRLQDSIGVKSMRYSSPDAKVPDSPDVLIIDSIGILSAIYRYGSIAYIGGGFGKGIHNTLEAATFGLPVIFGPNYKKFREAVELIQCKGAYSVRDYPSFAFTLNSLLQNSELLKTSGKNARNYIISGLGATDKILQHISKDLLSVI